MDFLPFALSLLAITVGLPMVFGIILWCIVVVKEKISKKFEKTLDKISEV